MAALGKVSEGPHSSTDCQVLDLQVAGLQGTRVFQYPWPKKLVARPGIKRGCPAYMPVALHFELLTTPVTMKEETLTDDP